MDKESEFVEAIRAAASETNPQASVENALRSALADWNGHPPWMDTPTEGVFGLLYGDENVTIMNIVWPPHMITDPHTHNMWATIGLYDGRENNVIWQRKGDTITPCEAHTVSVGEILSLPADAIHSVFNPLARHTGAIHVYGGDFMNTAQSEWDSDSHRERPRDMAAIRQAFQGSGDPD